MKFKKLTALPRRPLFLVRPCLLDVADLIKRGKYRRGFRRYSQDGKLVVATNADSRHMNIMKEVKSSVPMWRWQKPSERSLVLK